MATQRFPSPNKKYPFVGPNYQQYGEVAGYIYYPWTDEYYADPNAVKDYGIEAGYIEPEKEPPGMIETLGTIAGTGAALSVGSEIGKGIPGLFAAKKGAAVATPQILSAGPVGSGVAASGAPAVPQVLGASPIAPAPAAPGIMGTLLPAAGVVAGGYTGLKQFEGAKNILEGDKMDWQQKAALALPTFGLSLISDDIGLTGRKSTKDYQNERWGALDPELQFLKEANHPGDDDGIWTAETDPTGQFIGQKWNFDDAKVVAKADPKRFIGAYGNVDTFGKPWLSLEQEKQEAVVRRLLDADLYDSNKGDILIRDEDQPMAAQIFKEETGIELEKYKAAMAEAQRREEERKKKEEEERRKQEEREAQQQQEAMASA